MFFFPLIDLSSYWQLRKSYKVLKLRLDECLGKKRWISLHNDIVLRGRDKSFKDTLQESA